jgi:hypothetical protein
MTEIILDKTLDEAQETVIHAFDRTEGIEKYQKSQHQVVGETGVSFPRVLWSYGENVYVDLSETGESDKTKIDVRAEKEVSVNIGANPEKYKRRFLDELNALRELPTERNQSSPAVSTADTDVEMEEGSGDGTSTLAVIVLVTMAIFFGMWFLMMLSMPY